MWVRGFARSIRPLVLALSCSACAHGIDTPIDLKDAEGSGAAGAGGMPGVGGGGPGSGGTAGAGTNGGTAGSSGASTGGAGGSGGDLDSGLGGAGGAAMADAKTDSSSTGGAGGSGGVIDAGPDIREATVDARPDVFDAGCGNATQCALKAGLAHRYSFSGAGNTVTDSVGTANATVMNAQLNGSGSLVLAGGTQYVDLPNGIISQLNNATLEIWLTWTGTNNWERIFDFGNSTTGENTQGAAASSLYFTPGGTAPTVMFVAFKRADQASGAESRALSVQRLTAGAMVHLAVVLDHTNSQISLYRNGSLDGSGAWTDQLSVLTDVNNWLGRSQYAGDLNFNGTLHEFRIYNVALTAAAVQTSFMGGTDPAFLN